MPMVPASLKSELESIYSSGERQPNEAAQKYAKAVVALWESATPPGFGSVTAAQTQALITQQLTNVFKSPTEIPVQAAQQIASALNSALGSIIISGGLSGTGTCTPLGIGLLIGELTNIYSTQYENPGEVAQKEAQAIVNFSKATLCMCTGSESPPIPKIGPLA